jgi:hypothetical protein
MVGEGSRVPPIWKESKFVGRSACIAVVHLTLPDQVPMVEVVSNFQTWLAPSERACKLRTSTPVAR